MAQITTLRKRGTVGVAGRPNVMHCFAANLTAFPAVKEFEDRLIT